MMSVALQFANGNAFFCGIALLVAAAVAAMRARNRAWVCVLRVCTAAGVICIALSATPLAIWFYGLWGLPVLWLLVAGRGAPRGKGWYRHAAHVLAIVLSVVAAALELPWHIIPDVGADPSSRFVVIGDSISAGVGDGTRTWPAIWRKEFGANVTDMSQPGLTTRGALRQAQTLGPEDSATSVLILEIGGNDMLGWATAAQFERDLDALLGFVCSPSRTVVLLELPLPPFYNAYGQVQRKLATRHGAVLIPKRVFARVLGSKGGTIDGLHLSELGHLAMARSLWAVVTGSRAKSGTGTRQ